MWLSAHQMQLTPPVRWDRKIVETQTDRLFWSERGEVEAPVKGDQPWTARLQRCHRLEEGSHLYRVRHATPIHRVHRSWRGPAQRRNRVRVQEAALHGVLHRRVEDLPTAAHNARSGRC